MRELEVGNIKQGSFNLTTYGGAIYQLNGEEFVYPGQLVTYAAFARVKKGKKTCEKPIDVTKVTLTPSAPASNKAEDPIALSSTDFSPEGGGKFVSADLKAKGNEVTFLLWDPAQGSYRLTMGGTVSCFGQTLEVKPEYTIVVKHPTLLLDDANSSCASPTYDLATNVASTNCNVRIKTVEGGPSPASVTYGLLQLAQADVKFQALSEAPILNIGENSLDCKEEVSGKCASSITKQGSVLDNTNLQTISSIFTAPYSSATECDYSALNVVNKYNADFTYATYFMMKPSGGYWVPFARTQAYKPGMKVTCAQEKGCGLGLGTQEEKYSTPWTVSTQKVAEIKLDLVGWKAQATLPNWKGIFQDQASEESQYIALAAYFEGSKGNSWIMCPNPSFVETVPSFSETFSLESEAQFMADETREFVEV